MIFHPSELSMDEDLQERLQQFDPGFPFTAMDCELDRYNGKCVTWHWHETLEINYVVRGTLETSTRHKSYLLAPGQAIFINSNVLHRNRAPMDMRGVQIHTLLFDRSMIAASKRAHWHYVRPIVANPSLDALVFQPENPETAAFLQNFRDCFSIAEHEPVCYELAITSMMQKLWAGVFCQGSRCSSAKRSLPVQESVRIKQMLTFIREHYAEEISPADIASAAGIGERECFRCFRQELDCTPLESLTDYRINIAARRLMDTGQSITQIALDCGYSTVSYFGKVFRQKMQLTPREYRNRSQKD